MGRGWLGDKIAENGGSQSALFAIIHSALITIITSALDGIFSLSGAVVFFRLRRFERKMDMWGYYFKIALNTRIFAFERYFKGKNTHFRDN